MGSIETAEIEIGSLSAARAALNQSGVISSGDVGTPTSNVALIASPYCHDEG
jgi:hypothetical protein